MTLGEALREGRQALAGAGLDDAELEAELLLRHAIAIDRAALIARLDEPLDPARYAAYQALLARRLAREPTPYITGRREFYGLEFEVTPAALIPRPETELLVGEGLRILGARGSRLEARVADVGTGCGAVAVALAAHLPVAAVVASDTSREALRLAARNARRHGVADRVMLAQTDLLSGLGGPFGRLRTQPFDVVVANLPYVPTRVWESLPPEIRDHEPRAALDGGADGLACIRRLIDSAPGYLAPGGAILLEIGHDQDAAVLALARRAFPDREARVVRDAAGRERVVVIE